MAKQNRENILNKVRNLFNLTQDAGAFEGEIRNASRMMQKLMDKHQISMAEIVTDADDQEAQEKFVSVRSDIRFGRVRQWHWYLASSVARITGTKHYSQRSVGHSARDPKGHKRRVSALSFFGPEQSVELATELFYTWAVEIDLMARKATTAYCQTAAKNGWVQEQMVKAGVRQYRHLKGLGSNHPNVWRNSWLNGVMEAVSRALHEQEEERTQETSTALMVIYEKLTTAYEGFSADFNHINTGMSSTHNHEAFVAGEQAGQGLNLNSVKAARLEN